jgi:hypothetical protein
MTRVSVCEDAVRRCGVSLLHPTFSARRSKRRLTSGPSGFNH